MSAATDRLVGIMKTLRSPNGCPWDIKQDFKSIAQCTIEEAYEVVETIETGDMDALREELGDLLLQVVFHAQMASEKGFFNFDDVTQTISNKLIERHPHVFGDRTGVKTGDDVLKNWEADKAAKREKKAREKNRTPSVLDGLSAALPSMTRALKMSQRMAHVGFDWQNKEDVLAKFHEETAELEAEINSGAPAERIQEELGDVMFALVNLARHFKIDPEKALRHCNRKVERRFRGIEERLAANGGKPEHSSLDEMEHLWQAMKEEERR